MHINAIDQALEGYASDKAEVEATLKDGSVVRGKIKNFDGYVVFMEGGNGSMLYRHSLLKLAPAMAARVSEAKAQPSENPRRERAQARPPARPQIKPNTRPRKDNRPPRPKLQEHKPIAELQEDTGRIGSMGEAMQKWLQSQKG